MIFLKYCFAFGYCSNQNFYSAKNCYIITISNYNSLFLIFFSIKIFLHFNFVDQKFVYEEEFCETNESWRIRKKRVNLMNMEWNEIFNYSSFALKNTRYV